MLKKKYLPFLTQFPLKRSGTFLYFLTISPKNYQDHAQGLDHLRKSFNKFRRTKYIRERFQAGIYVTESRNKNKYNEDKDWNVHIHAIIYGRYIDNKIRGKCFDCNQNLIKKDGYNKRFYCGNVKCNSLNVEPKHKDSKIVRLFQKASGRECNIRVNRLSTHHHTLNYMLKYIASNKDDFQSPEDLAQYVVDIRGKRLISTFGLFYKNRPVPIPQICHRCEEEIEIYTDWEVVKDYVDSYWEVHGYDSEPPPKEIQLDFDLWLENSGNELV